MAILRAAIIAIGDEVLQGEVVNTNATWLAKRLNALGVLVSRHTVVADQVKAIIEAGQSSALLADLILFCGGLGPTHDDCSSAAIAQWTGFGLVVDEPLRQAILARYQGRPGLVAGALKQATVIRSATLLPNSRGTAPGQLIAFMGKWLVMLPGPPRELQAIFDQSLVPWLTERLDDVAKEQRDTLVSYELGESHLFHQIEPLARGQHPLIGIYAGPGRVEVRLQAPKIGGHASINSLRAMAWLKSSVSSRLYASPPQTRPAAIIERLTQLERTVGVMESLTGGLLAESLIAVAGASKCVSGGIIAYTEEAKSHFGVAPSLLAQYGPVSPQCAQAMAQCARRQFKTSIGLAATGFAGPSGGTAKAPVGTVFVAVDDGEKVDVRRRHLSSERTVVRQAVVELALTALWELLELG